MKLSILIPTLNEPRNVKALRRLMQILEPQVKAYPGEVEIQLHEAGRNMPTGKKRNLLIQGSEGDYFCFVDDDDIVPPYYVGELMNAISKGPDVITFIGFMTTNGKDRRDFTIKLGSGYFEKEGHYYRYPNHLCCFKRDVVKDVKFPDIWFGEDFKWATEIMKRNLLKTAIHIEKWMYHYDYISNKPKPKRRFQR